MNLLKTETSRVKTAWSKVKSAYNVVKNHLGEIAEYDEDILKADLMERR